MTEHDFHEQVRKQLVEPNSYSIDYYIIHRTIMSIDKEGNLTIKPREEAEDVAVPFTRTSSIALEAILDNVSSKCSYKFSRPAF